VNIAKMIISFFWLYCLSGCESQCSSLLLDEICCLHIQRIFLGIGLEEQLNQQSGSFSQEKLYHGLVTK
jgi:hypothetical protein